MASLRTLALIAALSGAIGCASDSDRPKDAGAQDAGAVDTGVADAGRVDAGPSDAGANPEGPALDVLVAAIAAETCDLLLRCCDAEAQADYFAGIVTGPRIMEAGFEARVPPMAALDANSCPAVMQDLFTVQPFGPWVTAARAGQVGYRAAEAEACLATMRNAACGEPARAALFDGACLGFSPPLGGEAQRKLFTRTDVEGATCQTLTDGAGGAFYGTCDPTVAFCCVPDELEPTRCRIGEGAGACRRASQVDEPCSLFPELQLCATGLLCGDTVCEAEIQVDLAIGDLCFEEDRLVSLGTCVDGWCFTLGSNRCEARLPLGENCNQADACRSGACIEGTCAVPTFCEGP